MITTIVFDLGGVLINWDPRNLYRKIFTDEKEMEYFLSEVCNHDWNHQQDAGRDFTDAVDELLPRFPQYESQILAYRDRWTETLGGPVHESVEILKKLVEAKSHRMLALTNWSHETFPHARRLYPFLGWFENILVSGEEKLAKPDPAIYHLLFDKFEVDPATAIFIDDSEKNVIASREVGMQAIHFVSPEQMGKELRAML